MLLHWIQPWRRINRCKYKKRMMRVSCAPKRK
jgi:hypothetical protein